MRHSEGFGETTPHPHFCSYWLIIWSVKFGLYHFIQNFAFGFFYFFFISHDCYHLSIIMNINKILIFVFLTFSQLKSEIPAQPTEVELNQLHHFCLHSCLKECLQNWNISMCNMAKIRFKLNTNKRKCK